MGKARAKAAIIASIGSALGEAMLPGDLEGFDTDAIMEAAAFSSTALGNRALDSSSIAIDTVTASDGRRTMRLAVVNPDIDRKSVV